jgi:hypothetical protein
MKIFRIPFSNFNVESVAETLSHGKDGKMPTENSNVLVRQGKIRPIPGTSKN